MTLENVIQHIEENFQQHTQDLIKLCEVPSVSFPNYDAAVCRDNAKMIVDYFTQNKLENIQLLEIEGAHPYIYAEHCHQPGKPTVLLYGHYDVQPIGRKDIWESDPFAPVIKKGVGGDRLYGRGTADDKAAIVMHVAMIRAFVDTRKELPVNVKILIEGEEEIGSAHFPEFMQKHKELLKSDVMIVPDSTFADVGVPTITFSLRGVCTLSFALKGMKAPLHSGLFGGLIPDPALALSKICANLVDNNGVIAVKEIADMIPPLTEKEKEVFSKVPFDEASYRKKSGLFDTTQLVHNSPYPMAQVWRLPHLTVNAMQASSREQAGNIIVSEAWTRLTVRTPAGMNAKNVLGALKKHVQSVIPWGLSLEITGEDYCDGWQVDINGKDKKYFDLAVKSFQSGYDQNVVLSGCGASIPLVKTYTDSLNAPALLTPLHDPYGNIHAENESLHLEDWKKGMFSQIYFLEGLAK